MRPRPRIFTRSDTSLIGGSAALIIAAGNAVENVVGTRLAAKNRSEYALSVVINSPLQIALVLAPARVILSRVFGFTPLTPVFPPMLVVSVAIAVLLAAFITFDGESDGGEGVSLLALYAIIATAVWWGEKRRHAPWTAAGPTRICAR